MEGIHLFFLKRDLNGFSALPEGHQMKPQGAAAAGCPKPASLWRGGRSLAYLFITTFLNLKGEVLGKENKQSAILGVI